MDMMGFQSTGMGDLAAMTYENNISLFSNGVTGSQKWQCLYGFEKNKHQSGGKCFFAAFFEIKWIYEQIYQGSNGKAMGKFA